MLGRILTVFICVFLISLIPVIGIISLLVKWLAWELVIFSPIWVTAYLYVKCPKSRYLVRGLCRTLIE